MLVRRRPPWFLAEREATPEALYLSRRSLLALGAGAAFAGCRAQSNEPPDGMSLESTLRVTHRFALPRNAKYTLDRDLTDERVAASHNNFYEFASTKDVWKRTSQFGTDPWTVEVTGLVAKPVRFTIDELIRAMTFEERLYRHRCVEAWSMAVPWSGFPLARLLQRVEPKASARFVRFVSFSDPQQMPGVREQPWIAWPYYEGLRIDEAMHELTFVAIGIYGHVLPKQHGAPIRIVVPWKYGYKSAKSIVRIELVEKQPSTFWQDIAPNEYPFESNVDPWTPHPRWSQATEKLLGVPFGVRRTLPFNGYGTLVSELYRS